VPQPRWVVAVALEAQSKSMATEITALLGRWGQGDRGAFEQLLPLVYAELRRLARQYLHRERPGHLLQPTALVHETYLRLGELREARLNNRGHFYGAAARIMRRVLVDEARRCNALKRGGPERLGQFEPPLGAVGDSRVDVEALDEALAALERFAPEKAKVVELRYFGGLSVEETSACLEISPATVKRHWSFSRAWLFSRLQHGGPSAAAVA